MSFILESPRMGGSMVKCYLTLSSLGYADVTVERASAQRFPSKSLARKAGRLSKLCSFFEFTPVEVET